jgi:hypothetical protein
MVRGRREHRLRLRPRHRQPSDFTKYVIASRLPRLAVQQLAVTRNYPLSQWERGNRSIDDVVRKEIYVWCEWENKVF